MTSAFMLPNWLFYARKSEPFSFLFVAAAGGEMIPPDVVIVGGGRAAIEAKTSKTGDSTSRSVCRWLTPTAAR